MQKKNIRRGFDLTHSEEIFSPGNGKCLVNDFLNFQS